MKVNHDIKVRRAGHTITVWCKTHDDILFVHQGRGDVPLATVLEAVADHRGTPARTVGHVHLARNDDGTYRLDMEDVNLSAVVLAGSAFVIQHTEHDEKFVTITLSVDSIDFAGKDVKTVKRCESVGAAAGEAPTLLYESTLYGLEEPSRP